MSFILKFSPAGMTSAKYDECIKKLNDAGVGAPKGRSYHVCYGSPDEVTVTDVWDSIEDFQAFGETLIPILQSIGVDPGQPEVKEVYNVIIGKESPEIHSSLFPSGFYASITNLSTKLKW